MNSSGKNPLAVAGHWLWAHPLVMVLAAQSLFCVGIWNAREGYVEETSNVSNAFRVLDTHAWSSSIYVDLLALTLKYLAPDPLAALTLIKYLSSLLATVATWLALRRFNVRIGQGALLLACLLWIASAFNAPHIQSASLSLFTFAIMLLGLDGLLTRVSVPRVVVFCILGLLAGAMRPEYFLPLFLGLLVVASWAARRWTRGLEPSVLRRGLWVGGSVLAALLVLLWLKPPVVLQKKAVSLDQYALFGLGQCYAGFYHQTHANEIFNPATEYQETLDRVFGQPKGFLEAARNNPGELARYLALNGGRNLFLNLPKILIGRYREQSEKDHGWLYWAVRVGLVAGGIAGARRAYRARQPWAICRAQLASGWGTEGSVVRSLILLAVLASAALPAIVLLIPLRRYYLPCTPLFFLAVAYGLDSLLIALRLVRFQGLIVALAAGLICRPNFLVPRPNHEMNAVRQVAPLVRAHPVIAAWWAEPAVVLGLKSQASALSLWDRIKEDDITGGRIDILLIDENFRSAKTWAEQRAFFEAFERQPSRSGFRKLTGIPTGPYEVYYRPIPPNGVGKAESRNL